ncbi:AMIN-like domain-containing (lipo)protein [Antrihabitans stalactiti]|uniref:AMIN-like domain-containing protein n=1 Tax=Antrihabitans stalactiti TaxID=2584121 RepID=A0A848KHS7_9NOCA|nr:hypothetical protein [Antrihabitans stalactiti]NMN98295.1 hypothetical protein [Antrihabitans stalactiti]
MVAGLLLVAGCGSEQPAQVAAPTTSPPGVVTTTTTASPETEKEVAPTDSGARLSEHSKGAALIVTAVRIGRHDTFDRVVYEFGGKGVPGSKVRYVDKVATQGKGDDVPVAGESILHVFISGVVYPEPGGVKQYNGPDPLVEPTARVVTEVHMLGTFEGDTQSAIGTRTDKPGFRVTVLDNPTRLVIDIASG